MKELIYRQAAIDALNAYEDVVDTASQVFTIRGCKKSYYKFAIRRARNSKTHCW